jgi:hypothetical protein
MDAVELLQALPAYLGLDLQGHRAAHPGQPAPVVFLDTYEALWADKPIKTGLGAAETDAWVRGLVASTPGVLFVILGRERLTWDRRFPDQWAGLLDDQHLLGGLSEADADAFLRQVPIADAALRRAIIDGASTEDDPDPTPGASGAHPLHLDSPWTPGRPSRTPAARLGRRTSAPPAPRCWSASCATAAPPSARP